MYCENLAEKFKESLVGTWCDDEEGSEVLAPGLDGFATASGGKVGSFTNLSGPKTIVVWVRPSRDSEHAVPLASLRKDGDIDAGWFLWITREGRLMYGTGDGSYSDEKISDPRSVNRGSTSFITIVRDEQKVVTFHNGVKSDLNYLMADEKPATDLYVGHDPIIPWNKVEGLLQCVSVFDRALTDEEVQGIFEDGCASSEVVEEQELTEQL